MTDPAGLARPATNAQADPSVMRRAPLSMVVLFGFLPPAAIAAAPVTISADGGTITAGKFLVNNNTWGKSHSPNGHERVYADGTTSPLSWGAQYNWPEGDASYTVKAYPSVILGWHWGLPSPPSGLPVRIGDHRTVATGGSIKLTNPGIQNVAYDLWFHTLAHPGKQDQPTDELMVWVARYGGAGPLGKRVGQVKIGGATWVVYKGNVGWNVYSFMRTTNESTWRVDLRDFIDYAAAQGWLAPDKFLTSVEFGSEIFRTDGDGAFAVTGYRCDVE